MDNPAMRYISFDWFREVDSASQGLQLLKHSHQNITDIAETVDNVTNYAKGDLGTVKVTNMPGIDQVRTTTTR